MINHQRYRRRKNWAEFTGGHLGRTVISFGWRS